MGWAPPPNNWELLERMTPEQRRRFLLQERAFLIRCIGSNRANARDGVWWIAAAAFVSLLLIAANCFAVELPEDCRVRNRAGNCVFSNCATLGYRHGIPALQSLAPGRKVIDAPGPLDDEVRDRLHKLGVVWRGHDHGDYTRDLLPLANTHGVIVSMRRGTPWMWGKSLGCHHSIILTRYDSQGVAFYCPDNPQGIWRASREWFASGWLGNCMVFEGGGK